MAKISLIGEHWSTLSAAARLAVAGHQVEVVKSPLELNTELNITLPAALRDLFLKTGSPLEDKVELHDLDVMFHTEIAGKDFAMPGVGIGAAVNAIADTYGEQSGLQWKSLMSQAQVRWDAIRQTVENPQPNTAATWWHRPRSLRRHLSHTSKPVREIAIHSVELEQSATSFTADHIVLPYVASTFGMYSVQGGRHALHAALFERCNDLGVQQTISTSMADVTVVDSLYGVTPGPQDIDIHQYRRVGPAVAMSVLAGSAVSKAINERLLLKSGQSPR